VTDTGYRVEMVSGMRIVPAPAAIDITMSDELRRVFLDVAADGHAAVVVDMTRTRFCDLDGFSVLVGAHRRALATDGGLMKPCQREVASSDAL
jgi:anti-anti-sigma regulatory factor